MSKIKLEKITQELDKGTTEEKIQAFHSIKDHITKAIQEEQKLHEEKANHLQSTLDRIKNNL